MIADLAIQQTGAVSVPIYPTIHANELQFILEDAAVKMVLVGDQALYRKVTALRADLPALAHVCTFAPVAGAPHWRELLAEVTPDVARQLDGLRGSVQETDLATILYTSGTTGTPKGVMLSHRNILSNVFSSAYLFEEIGVRGRRALSFLPLNHAFERTATYCYFYCGVSVYYAESVATIRDNMVEVKPTVCTTVPRLLEKIYEGIMAKGAKLTGRPAAHLPAGRSTWPNASRSTSRCHPSTGCNWPWPTGWCSASGARRWGAISGPSSRRGGLPGKAAADLYRAGIVVMEGYGLTETSPVISGNRYTDKNRMFGTVGPLLKDVEVKFGEDGEILCKGPNVMMGYYRRPDLTAEVMSGEWLHTGDIGNWWTASSSRSPTAKRSCSRPAAASTWPRSPSRTRWWKAAGSSRSWWWANRRSTWGPSSCRPSRCSRSGTTSKTRRTPATRPPLPRSRCGPSSPRPSTGTTSTSTRWNR
jgi:long-chain acyl-CoA synthetase